ncbi:hypothetical protein G6L30_17085 [Agrobacterium rhizogenes]|nr:hypothetical protein [Rhizobium rhizogenes]
MIEAKNRKVYFSPAANRTFMTLPAAAHKEASALMVNKYPTERDQETHSGWHWSSDEKLRAIHYRLKRRIMSRFRRAALSSQEGSE